MACLNDEEIVRYSEGSATAEEQSRWRAHIRTCARCRPLVLDMVRVADPNDPGIRVRMAGRYQLQGLLGMGSMGVVHAAFDPELGRRLAVKILQTRGDPVRTQHYRARFVREAKSLAQIVHPNVVSIYDVGQIDDRIFIAMELVEGGTLRDWLLQDGRSFDTTLALFEQIGRGLGAVHKAGLVHRDFKPENVLIGADGRPRVTDFGLARAGLDERDITDELLHSSGKNKTLSMTQTGALLGTPAYMAPEQLRGEEVDARADIFAFCVVLWEALFGVRPFAGSSVAELAASIRAQQPIKHGARLSRVQAAIVPALLRGLEHAPDDRYRSIDELLGHIHRLRRPRRKTGRIVAAFAATMLLGGVAAGVVVWRAEEKARCAQNPFASIWSDARRSALLQRLASTVAPAIAPEYIVKRIDQYQNQLVAVRAGACEATYLRRERSEFAFEAQLECLSGLSHGLDLLIEELHKQPGLADPLEVLGKLEKPVTCLDRKPRGERPSPSQQAISTQLGRRLAEAHNALLVGRREEARAAYEKLVSECYSAGEMGLEAQALVGQAQAELDPSQARRAITLFDQAVATALYAEDYRAAAAGYIELLDIANAIGRDPAESLRIGRLVSVLIERGRLSNHYRYRLWRALGETYGYANRVLESELHLRAALAATDDPIEQAPVYLELSGELIERLDYRGASALIDRAEALFPESSAADPQKLFMIPVQRAHLALATGDTHAAATLAAEVVRRVEQNGSPSVAVLIETLADLSLYQQMDHQRDAAYQSALRALDLSRTNGFQNDGYGQRAALQLASLENDRGNNAAAAVLLAPLVDSAVLKTGAPMEQLRLHYELGRAWFRSTDRVHQKAARDHLAKAAALSRTLPPLFELTSIRAELVHLGFTP